MSEVNLNQAAQRIERYIAQIMAGAHLDPAELSGMLFDENMDDPLLAIIGEKILKLYHTTNSGFDVIAVAAALEETNSLESVGGLPYLMVLIDKHSDKCPHCGQSFSSPSPEDQH